MSCASLAKDKLVFKSTSADKKPGAGVHESVADSSVYSGLARIKDWRRHLSNFDCSDTFAWQGPFAKPYTFRSVEHAFQAAKIHLADPAAAYRFTLESGDPIGAGDGSVAQKHRRLMKLSPAQLTIWASISNGVMKSAAEAKYTQNPEGVAAKVLKETRDAELLHIVTSRGKPSSLVRFSHLEAIRSSL